jgi:hypothetical protein
MDRYRYTHFVFVTAQKNVTNSIILKLHPSGQLDDPVLVSRHPSRKIMTLGTILLIILLLLLVGAIPSWPHSRGWGYAPSGGIGLVLVIVLVLLLTGRL